MESLPPRSRVVGEYHKSGLSLNHLRGCPLDCAYCIRHTYGLWDQPGHALACLHAADRSQRPAERPAAFIRGRLLAFIDATRLTGAS